MAQRVAEFATPIIAKAFPAGTPAPTAWRLLAVGPVTRSVEVPYAVTAPTPTFVLGVLGVLVFEDATESGQYVGTIELWSGGVRLEASAPIPFLIPSQPVEVTYFAADQGYQVRVR